jgi:hypothetical protein
LKAGNGFLLARTTNGNTVVADREASLAEVPPVTGFNTGNRVSE